MQAMQTKRIYLDNAATTPLCDAAAKAMAPYMESGTQAPFGNANSLHSIGREAFSALEDARARVARALKAHRPDEIVFTGGATESDNSAIVGMALGAREKARLAGKHGPFKVVTSRIEHEAVLETSHMLRALGFEFELVDNDGLGRVTPEALKRIVDENTLVVSVMAANNEVGTIQPIAALSAVCRKHGAPFHTDAVQAYGHIPLDVSALGVDALSVSAHKFHGPKGVGFLYCRKGLATEPLISGGAQERGYRAGTENLAGIVGMEAAARLAFGGNAADSSCEELAFSMAQARVHVASLRNYMARFIENEIPDIRINGSGTQHLPGILSVSFQGVSGEALLGLLDQQGVCASAGSACASGSLEPSHVLTAMGIPAEWAQGTIRFSFSAFTEQREVERACQVLRDAVHHLRNV